MLVSACDITVHRDIRMFCIYLSQASVSVGRLRCGVSRDAAVFVSAFEKATATTTCPSARTKFWLWANREGP